MTFVKGLEVLLEGLEGLLEVEEFAKDITEQLPSKPSIFLYFGFRGGFLFMTVYNPA